MAKTQKSWITDQAVIDTILALRVLEEGDELLFCEDELKLHAFKAGQAVTVTHVSEPEERTWWRAPKQVPLVCHARSGESEQGIARDNIAGWRRPLKP